MKQGNTILIAVVALVFSSATYALSGEWQEDIDFAPAHITFESSKTYALKIDFLGLTVNIAGEYAATQNGIQILSLHIQENSDTEHASRLKSFLENNSCTLSNGIPSLKYSESLTCEKDGKALVFWNPQSASQAGIEMEWQGDKVVTTGVRTATTTDCVRMREKPALKGRVIQYKTGDFEAPVMKNCVPKNETITVYARTPAKQKVQGRLNYWYLMSDMAGYHWVFGEFIKFAR